MNIEGEKNFEISPGKTELLQLQGEDKYLFHGSPKENIEELEPRQGRTISRGGKELVNDGELAVSATPYAEVAIFKALVRYGRSGFSSIREEGMQFEASKEALERIQEKGYIYVLSRASFSPRNSFEWRAKERVKPIRIIEVEKRDLVKDIKLIG